MKAKVKVAFRGRRDNAPQVETLNEGDIIEGDLAEVAVREKWAVEINPAKLDAAEEKLSAARSALADAEDKLAKADDAGKANALKAVDDARAAVAKAEAAVEKLS